MASHREVQKRQLQQILRDLPVQAIALIGALEPIQEVRGGWHNDVETQGRQHRALHEQDVIPRVSVISDVDEVVHLRRVDLLELRSNEHRGHTHELKALPHHRHLREIAVDEVDREEEGLGPQLVLHVNLHKPIDEDRAHLRIDVLLLIHVVRPHCEGSLLLEKHIEDVGDVLHHGLHVLQVALPLDWQALNRWCSCRHRRQGWGLLESGGLQGWGTGLQGRRSGTSRGRPG
mmetsp:Transcript_135473/g.289740  ORF Transcript_135473/g.289740 Transcript_135473/m.289740 type:complete len:232 (+) Transcript_135473:371-1066(+)